jgi:putative hydrolase of the HAD superfamily
MDMTTGTAGANATIDAVLWDYGGVFTASPFGAAHAYAHAQGADPDVLVNVVFGPYDTDTDHAWHRLERGELALTDAIPEISADAAAAGLRFDLLELFGSMRADEFDRTVVVDTVRSVRARGIRTAIITNNIREYGDAWRGQLAINELFDLVVDSSAEGVRKPDPAIFHLTLERLGVGDPSRAVFLDDFPGNVAAARRLGIHAILVADDPRPALASLDGLLGPSPA